MHILSSSRSYQLPQRLCFTLGLLYKQLLAFDGLTKQRNEECGKILSGLLKGFLPLSNIFILLALWLTSKWMSSWEFLKTTRFRGRLFAAVTSDSTCHPVSFHKLEFVDYR